MRRIFATVVCVTVLSGFGCATYVDDLNRAERHYQENQHERALALFRVIEADMDSLSYPDRTRYAYLRGINDYRLSGKRKADGTATTVDKAYRAHARHWLAIARSLDRERPGGMRPEWKTNLDEAMRDLNQDVYGVGVFPEEAPGSAREAASDQSTDESPAEDKPPGDGNGTHEPADAPGL